MAIKVLIADDHQLFREGMRNLLARAGEIEVIGEAINGREVAEMLNEQQPHVILMDIIMPEVNGITATMNVKKEYPEIKIIALTMHTEKHFVKEMLKAGAAGYLFKDCSFKQLVEAIDVVAGGQKYLSSEVTNVVVSEYVNGGKSSRNSEGRLTEREAEIFKLIAEGHTIKDISEMLYVSIKTVGTHKKNILKKLKLKSTTDLVKYALKNQIISLD